MKLDPTKQWGVVAYTDGGARPNPGHIGMGVHGYIYEIKEVDKPTLLKNNMGNTLTYALATDKGYKECDKDGKIIRNAKEAFVNVEPAYYLKFCGSGSSISTNNVAEMRAYYHTLIALRDQPIKTVHLICDSDYTLSGVEKRLKGRNLSYNPNGVVANAELWDILMEAYQQCTDNGIEITQRWQRGHIGDLGNSSADWLATIGVFKSPDGVNQNEFHICPAKKFWETEVTRHPFLNFKRVYFNRIASYNIPGQYYAADPGGVDEHIGKRTPDSGYAVIRLKEPDTTIEAIRQRQFDYSQDMNAIMMLKMDRAFSKEVYGFIQEHGKYCLFHNPKHNNANLSFLDEGPITVDVNPMGLMMRTLDGLALLEELLDKFLAYLPTGTFEHPDNNQHLNAHDITSVFYQQIEKKVGKLIVPKMELRKEFVNGYRNHLIEIQEEHRNSLQTLKVPLILGIDLPPRNNLKHLETESPKVYLITWRESENSLRYATVIESTTGIGIWSNFYADRLFFQPKP